MRHARPLFHPFEGDDDWPKPVERKPKGDAESHGAAKPPDDIDIASAEGELDPRLAEHVLNKTEGVGGKSSKIRTFQQQLGGKRHEDSWNRTPNVTGAGAIHVKSFHCKLTGDSLAFLDRQINEWLDDHPQYEVKMVTTSVGEWTGKLKEPNLIVNVWV